MANCQDELTSIDSVSLSLSASSLASSSTSSNYSLFPFLLLDQSFSSNLVDPATLPRLLRPLDSKDIVVSNDELEGDEGAGGIWSGGCVESQYGDDEIGLHVSSSSENSLNRIRTVLIWWT